MFQVDSPVAVETISCILRMLIKLSTLGCVSKEGYAVVVEHIQGIRVLLQCVIQTMFATHAELSKMVLPVGAMLCKRAIYHFDPKVERLM